MNMFKPFLLLLFITFIFALAGCQNEAADPGTSTPGTGAGYADSIYHNGKIYTLDEQRSRAEAVGEYLSAELGVPEFRVSAVGYGETRPIANNETAQGRARNRRIDVRIEQQLE